jgi:hypothetical protein
MTRMVSTNNKFHPIIQITFILLVQVKNIVINLLGWLYGLEHGWNTKKDRLLLYVVGPLI